MKEYRGGRGRRHTQSGHSQHGQPQNGRPQSQHSQSHPQRPHAPARHKPTKKGFVGDGVRLSKEDAEKQRRQELDRQMRDYWIGKSKSQGGEEDFAKKKLNDELDEYWKNREQAAKKDPK